MAGSVIAVTLIAGQIGVKPRGQWFAALFTLTLPMGILQSTSTQTDYIAGFWSLCVFYYILSECRKFLLEGKAGITLNPILLGFSLSLGVLTKGTVYAVVFPILIYYLIVLIRKHLWKVIAGMVLLGGVCVFVLNAPSWLRNYSVYRSILGPGAGSVGSSTYVPQLVFSTALKNATNQLALPVGPVNKVMFVVMEKIHETLGLDINDPRTSLNEYRIRFSFHEDFAGNPGHFLIWILSTVFISIVFIGGLLSPHMRTGSMFTQVVEKYPLPIDRAFSYTLLLIVGYFLFALLFKWQSYNSRLLLPWLIAIGPLAGWFSELIRPRIVLAVLTALFAIGGLPYLLANPSRPLIRVGENKSILLASRTEVQFYNTPEIRDGLISVVVAAKDYDCASIGLELDSSTPEYLIWYILAANDQTVYHVENLSSTPETSRLIDATYRPCVVFCNTCTATEEKGYQQVYNRGSLELYVDPFRK
jgi:4-amino-4-deoxy-L-arabinose transferase-like glycosyltransferase